MNTMKPGYKQTEVGVIPEDWEVQTIGELIESRSIIGHLDGNHGELYPRSEEFKSYGVPYIGANDFEDGSVTLSRCKFLALERAKRFRKGVAINGDVLFAHNATVGPVALLITCEPFVILSTTATYFRCDLFKLDNGYLKAALQSPYFVGQYQAVMGQSTRFQVPITAQRKLSLVVPPLPEQRAIAGALSDVDALLGAQEALLAKKRDLKAAAMQQLLTGETRLPGFTGEWEVKRLGEVAVVSKGTQLHSSETDETGTFAHLNGGIAPSSYTHKPNTDGNTIAISEGGNSCGFVQFMTEPYWCGGHCYSVIPNGVDNRFLYLALKGQQSAIMGLRVGSGLPNVQKTSLLDFKIQLPTTLPEQTAIAAVLSDMDAEIAALKAQRDKTRALKQGMMQELLTGRIRLV
jgi:type I restriction enzyme S subunit